MLYNGPIPDQLQLHKQALETSNKCVEQLTYSIVY